MHDSMSVIQALGKQEPGDFRLLLPLKRMYVEVGGGSCLSIPFPLLLTQGHTTESAGLWEAQTEVHMQLYQSW